MSSQDPGIVLTNDNKDRNVVKIKNPINISGISIDKDDTSSISSTSTLSVKPRKLKKEKVELNHQNLSHFEMLSNPQKRKIPQHIEYQQESEYTTEESVSGYTSISQTSKSSSKSRSTNSEHSVKKSSHEERSELLAKLQGLENRGIRLSKKFHRKSKIREMRDEYERHKKELEMKSSIKFSQKMLMACVTAIEFLNKRFDPFHVKLDGWSETVHENINDYEHIFERLYEKYSGKAKMAPEIELLFSLAGSAFMFHLTNSLFKNALPGLGNVLGENSGLMQNIASSMANNMENNQGSKDDVNMKPPDINIGSLLSQLSSGMNNSSNPVPSDVTRPKPSDVQSEYSSTSSDDRFSDVSSDISSDDTRNVNISVETKKNKKSKRALNLNI